MPDAKSPALGGPTPAHETATSSIGRLRRLHLIQLVAMALLALLGSIVIIFADPASDQPSNQLVTAFEPQR